jgi:hypothetical protein
MPSANRRLELLGALGLLGLTALALCLCLRGPESAVVQTPSDDEHSAVSEIALAESEWWTASVRGFPGDAWSQDDHFHNLEHQRLLHLAQHYGLTPAAIFRGIQENIRQRRIPRRRVTTVPIKPRSFYD